MSESDRASTASSVPPALEIQSLEAVAAKITARARGVVGTPRSELLRAAGRALLRLLALPWGIVSGATLGVLVAPLFAAISGSWSARIARLLLAPFAGLAAGTVMGWRMLVRGKIDALPLAASVVHRFAPVIAFPPALSQHLFGLVLVTRYDDVRIVLERDDVFRVDGYDDRMRATSGAFLLGMDPGATYDKERQLVATALGHELAPLRELVADLSRALVEQANDRSATIDVVSELAHAVQATVLERFYGVPDTRDERLIPWLETTSYFIFNAWIGGPYRTAATEAARQLTGHLRRVVRRRSDDLALGAAPRDDVLGRLLEAIGKTSGDPRQPSNEDRAVRTMAGLISGATVPTLGLFINALDFLLDLSADERAAMRKAAHLEDDLTVKRFLFEAARFYAYPPTLYRHARMSYVFHAGSKHEATAARGAWVITLPVLANYDARAFPNPASYNPMREHAPDREPLLFGWAQHRCAGAHLAELIMVEMAKPLFAKGISRSPGPDGRLTTGNARAIPDGAFARRLVVRFD